MQVLIRVCKREMSIVDAFLDQVTESEQREFLRDLIVRISEFGAIPTNQGEWRQIVESFHTLIRLIEPDLLTVWFFIAICNNHPLQCTVLAAEPTQRQRRFFREKWLPYAKRLTEVLRRTNSKEMEQTYAQYGTTLRQSWRLKTIAPHPQLPQLDSIECIHLVHLSLPPDESLPPVPP
jgi:hypothetical protein